MRYHKSLGSGFTKGNYFRNFKMALNMIITVGLLFGFLVLSYKLILNDGDVTVFNIQSVKNVDKTNINVKDTPEVKGQGTSVDSNGTSGIKVSDINITNVSVYLTEENRTIELPLEEYIKGVVSSEMPLNFNKEALKAQAIAARTYTAAHIKSISGGCSKGNGADLCDSVHCQVFVPKERKLNELGAAGEAKWTLVEEAVEETKGMVMSYNGELITSALYFSTSGGRTENVEDVFSQSLPYLRSVESSGEETAPRYSEGKTIDIARFVDTINNSYPDADLQVGNLESQIQILSHTDGGCVKDIKLGSITINGVKFRKLFGLNSANFTLEYLSNEVVINCMGFGHGVGMSQWGANIMAQNGSSAEDIIKHYYTGVEIEKLK